MGDIEEAARNLAQAVKGVYAATGAFSVNAYRECMGAQVHSEEFEKIAEGRETKLVGRGTDQHEFPCQREVMIGGVKFYCLLTEEQKVEEDYQTAIKDLE